MDYENSLRYTYVYRYKLVISHEAVGENHRKIVCILHSNEFKQFRKCLSILPIFPIFFSVKIKCIIYNNQMHHWFFHLFIVSFGVVFFFLFYFLRFLICTSFYYAGIPINFYSEVVFVAIKLKKTYSRLVSHFFFVQIKRKETIFSFRFSPAWCILLHYKYIHTEMHLPEQDDKWLYIDMGILCVCIDTNTLL